MKTARLARRALPGLLLAAAVGLAGCTDAGTNETLTVPGPWTHPLAQNFTLNLSSGEVWTIGVPAHNQTPRDSLSIFYDVLAGTGNVSACLFQPGEAAWWHGNETSTGMGCVFRTTRAVATVPVAAGDYQLAVKCEVGAGCELTYSLVIHGAPSG